MDIPTAAPDARFASIQIDTNYLTPAMVDVLKHYIQLTEPMDVVQLLTQASHCLNHAAEPLSNEKMELLALIIQMAIDLEKERNIILAGKSTP